MVRETTGNQSKLSGGGGGVPSLWENTKLFTIFVVEGFPTPATQTFLPNSLFVKMASAIVCEKRAPPLEKYQLSLTKPGEGILGIFCVNGRHPQCFCNWKTILIIIVNERRL